MQREKANYEQEGNFCSEIQNHQGIRLRNAHLKQEKQANKCCTSSCEKRRNWTLEENRNYIQFLKDNHKSFIDEQSRRFQRVFLEMSLDISTKTPEQCRTHHQKALQKYKSVEKILSQLLLDAEKKEQRRRSGLVQIIQEDKNYKIERMKNGQIKIHFNLQKVQIW